MSHIHATRSGTSGRVRDRAGRGVVQLARALRSVFERGGLAGGIGDHGRELRPDARAGRAGQDPCARPTRARRAAIDDADRAALPGIPSPGVGTTRVGARGDGRRQPSCRLHAAPSSRRKLGGDPLHEGPSAAVVFVLGCAGYSPGAYRADHALRLATLRRLRGDLLATQRVRTPRNKGHPRLVPGDGPAQRVVAFG